MTKKITKKKKIKIKDIQENINFSRLIFFHPRTKQKCLWVSQWGYKDGGAGIWYRKYEEMNSTQIHPLFLDKLEDALELEVYKIL